ncbi:MAG: zinc ribbon domain-containing protein [Dorea sp.]
MLEYKAGWYGNEIHRVPTMYPSSQTCSCCGYRNLRIKSGHSYLGVSQMPCGS